MTYFWGPPKKYEKSVVGICDQGNEEDCLNSEGGNKIGQVLEVGSGDGQVFLERLKLSLEVLHFLLARGLLGS